MPRGLRSLGAPRGLGLFRCAKYPCRPLPSFKPAPSRVPAKRKQLRRCLGLWPGIQGPSVALTVSYVPHSLDGGTVRTTTYRTTYQLLERQERERPQVTSPPTIDVPIQWAIEGYVIKGGGGVRWPPRGNSSYFQHSPFIWDVISHYGHPTRIQPRIG